MVVFFRVDASLEIGTGHVMRCLTLADALKNRGADCEFVCREHLGNQLGLILERGYKAHALPLGGLTAEPRTSDVATDSPHASWLGADWELDAGQTLSALDGAPVDWLVVDHYSLDARWEARLSQVCDKLMVIDDLADRKHVCDFLLDQNLGRKEIDYAGWVPSSCSVLAGPHYALLRAEFATLREDSLRRREQPEWKHMLISMGGVDKSDATSQVLEALKACSLPSDFKICVVMGTDAPWLERVRSLAASLPWKTEVLVGVKDMARLMAGSDLAIGAAGSTSWERCCLGLPSILVVLAENQRGIGKALEEAGAAVVLQIETLTEVICQSVESMVANQSILSVLTANSCAIADGFGARRVVGKLFFGVGNEDHIAM